MKQQFRPLLLFILLVLDIVIIECQDTNSTLSDYTTTQLGDVGNKFTIIDSAIEDMIWCEKNNQIVFALTEKQSLYRSIDKGYTWLKLTTQLQNQGKLELDQEETEENIGGVKEIKVSKADPNKMIFVGSQYINWRSSDCGLTLVAMNQGRQVQEFQFHPQESEWLLAAAWSKCEDYEEGEPCKVIKELYYSLNFGEDWYLIEDYVVQFAWGQLLNHFMVPKQRIIVALDPNGQGHQKLKGWSNDVHLVITDDFFNTSTIILERGNKFVLTQRYLYGVQVSDQNKQEVNLFVSYSHLTEYKFNQAFFPFEKIKDFSYSILDDNEGQAFIEVNHQGPTSKMGNIYISNSRGDSFSTSLLNNVRLQEGLCDFDKVQSLNGVYIANIYEKKKVDQQRQANQEQSNGQKKKSREQSISSDLDNFKQTVISFNKGGIWEKLQAPEKDQNDNKIKCEDSSCSLHLHSASNSQFGPFYSHKNAMGIIIGTGNVGSHLSNRQSEISTYMSRDGGLNWIEIIKGSHIYELGDHGSLTLLVDDQNPIKNALFSWDEGLTQYNVDFAPINVLAQNIVTEPNSKATAFIIYGTVGAKGFISILDFASLHTKECIRTDNMDDEKNDYELWEVKDQRFSTCFQGRKIQYIRKKRERQCFNGMEYEPKQISSLCQCSEEDWECDIGFQREGNGPCKPNGRNITNNENNKCIFGKMTVTQGYRRVAGNMCIAGVDHSPIQISCGSDFYINYTYVFILFLIAFVLFLFSSKSVPDLVKQQLEIKKQMIQQKLQKYNLQKQIDNEYRQFDNANDDESQGINKNNQQSMFDDE